MEESAGLFSSFTDFPGFLITLQHSVNIPRLWFEYERALFIFRGAGGWHLTLKTSAGADKTSHHRECWALVCSGRVEVPWVQGRSQLLSLQGSLGRWLWGEHSVLQGKQNGRQAVFSHGLGCCGSWILCHRWETSWEVAECRTHTKSLW